MADPEYSRPASASRRPVAPTPILVSIGAATDCADVPRLSDEIRAELERGPAGPVVCDVGALGRIDAGTIDVVARLALETRRLGRGLRLLHAAPELIDLLGLAGLAAVAPCVTDSVVEVEGQSEQREPLRSVEEERDPSDRTA